jgi:hypothetical protein
MQVDSAAPFTSVAQQMSQAAQTPPPRPADGQPEPAHKASPSDGTGEIVDVEA